MKRKNLIFAIGTAVLAFGTAYVTMAGGKKANYTSVFYQSNSGSQTCRELASVPTQTIASDNVGGTLAVIVSDGGTSRPIYVDNICSTSAIRNRGELSEVVQAGFELEQIAVAPRANGCYCAPARTSDSGGCFGKTDAPPNERRRKA
jgi:hypothetical protein